MPTPLPTATDRWSCDILVVGAGPAGAAAAIEAARAGRDVVVIDRARFPRDKCCGDGLTTAALRHLDDLGFDPATAPSWSTVDAVHLRSPAGWEGRFPLRGDGRFAAVCRRRELDDALVGLARQHGATVLEGHALRAVGQRGDVVTARVEGITFEARYLVAADGMWSPTRKLLGLGQPRYRGEWHAFRQYFAHVDGPAADKMIVWFEPDLLPGYAWSFPLAGGVANVGFGIQRGRGHSVQDMASLWRELLARPHVATALGPGAEPESPHRAWPIPARLDRSPSAVGRVLFVGDAARATDPLTGEGIGQAIETARDAIRAIAAGGFDDPIRVVEQYRRRLASGMHRDHRLARGLSSALATPRWAELALRTAGATAWTRRNFARWLFEDYPRAVIATPRRWSSAFPSTAGPKLEARPRSEPSRS